MEEQENSTPTQMLTRVQQVLISNEKASENLEKSCEELDLKREKSRDDLAAHYQSVTTFLKEVYQLALEEIDNRCENKKEDLQRTKKCLTRCSLSLMPELENLKPGRTDTGSAIRRCKQTLEKLMKTVDLQRSEPDVTFNFIPKAGKMKLGFLQLCDNLPQDFTLRLLTPLMDIKIGQKILCGIEGNFTAENLRHLEFGIRLNNDSVPFVPLSSVGNVFSFSFSLPRSGVYAVLACLFGSPVNNSPLTLTIHNTLSETAMVNPLHVISDNPVKPSEKSDIEVEDGDKGSLQNDENKNNFYTEPIKKGSLNFSNENGGFNVEKPSIDTEQIKGLPNQDKMLSDKKVIKSGYEDKKGTNSGYEDKKGTNSEYEDKKGTNSGYEDKKGANSGYGDKKGTNSGYDCQQNKLPPTLNKQRDATTISRDKIQSNQMGSEVPSALAKYIQSQSKLPPTLDKPGEEGTLSKSGDEQLKLSQMGDTEPAERCAQDSFTVGDICVALWEQDGIWYNGQIEAENDDRSFLVKFVDYGNSDNVALSNIVKSSLDIPKDVPEYDVDEYVGSRADVEEVLYSKLKTSEIPKETVLDEVEANRVDDVTMSEKVEKTSFTIGSACVALWSEDSVWYNGIVEAVEKDGSYIVTFTDYGNSDSVREPFIVKDASTIPSEAQIDPNVGVVVSVPTGGKAPLKLVHQEESADGKSHSEKQTNRESTQRKISVSGVRMVTAAIKQVNKFNSKQENSQSKKQSPSPVSHDEAIKTDKFGKTATKEPSTTSKETLDNVEKHIVAEGSNSGDTQIHNNDRDNTHKKELGECVVSESTKECFNQTLTKKRRSKLKPALPRPLAESRISECSSVVWKAGDLCLAQWNDDVWYNAVIDNKKIQFEDDASCEIIYNVTFVDYGNRDQVAATRIVKSHDDLVLNEDHKVLDEHVKVDLPKLADANNLWKTGERCLAKDRDGIWYRATIQDINSSGLLTVQLIDYDRMAEVDLKFLVRNSQDIPKVHQQIVDENVKIEYKALEGKEGVDNETKMKEHVIGELGIARWSEDNVWYNAKIENVNEDGSLVVLFVDYGNQDTVKPPFFVNNTSLIEQTGEEILLDENVEEYVDQTILPQQDPVHQTSPLPASPTQDVSSRGSTFGSRTPSETEGQPFSLLRHLTKTDDGRPQLAVKCQLKLDNLSSPIGVTVLGNKNIVISCAKDNSVAIFRPDGALSAKIHSVRPFQKPTDLTTLSAGQFVIRDDLGLQMFTQEGVFVRELGANKIDKCFGLAEDEKGNIITINSVRPSRTAKPGSKGRGGITDVGETDIFFISRESGEVVQRIELEDTIADKNESKCRFLNYHEKTIYVVDLGLDCIYKIDGDVNVFTVGESGTGPEQFKDPAGIVVDDEGNFIVADSRNHRLHLYDKDNNFICFVAVDVPVRRPSGIYLDKELAELYVLNYWGNSMVKYRIGY